MSTQSPQFSRVPHFLAGAVAFAAAQAVLFVWAGSTVRPTIDSGGWFLNSAAGIAAMAIVSAAGSAAVARARPTVTLWDGWAAFVAGAALVFVATLFALGPGTIFPIVIAAGVLVIAAGALGGSTVGRLGRLRTRTR